MKTGATAEHSRRERSGRYFRQLLAAVFLLLLLLGGRGVRAAASSFDEGHIALSVGVISDTHLRAADPDSVGIFQRALRILKTKAAEADTDGLDAVCLVGNMTDNGLKSELTMVRDSYKSVLGSLPLFCITGNHETDTWWGKYGTVFLKDIKDVFGRLSFGYDRENDLGKGGYRHIVFRNYHFLFLEPQAYGKVNGVASPLKAGTKTWLKKTLQALTAAEPDRYIFLFIHLPVYKTVYGSNTGIGNDGPVENGTMKQEYWYTEDLADLLKSYPQVVCFSGHMHYPINDERSIMQTGFTALATGSVRYMSVEQYSYADRASKSEMQDSDSISNGLLLQADTKGNLRITRLDFTAGKEIKQAFTLNAPDAKGKTDLTKYSRSRGNKSVNAAPVFGENPLHVYLDTEGSVRVRIRAASDDDMVHHYVLKIKNESDGITKTYHILSDFYRHAQVEDMAASFTQKLASWSPGKAYTLTLTAYDSWGASGKAVLQLSETQSQLARLGTPKLKLSRQSTGAIKLSWSGISGAEAYRIYRRTENGSWKVLVQRTEDRSYTDGSVRAGTHYSYRIMALHPDESYHSAKSPVRSVTAPTARPTGLSLSNTAAGLRLSWTAVSRAQGYYIYRSSDGGDTYRRVKTVTGGEILTWTDGSSLKTGVRYFYKIKAWCSDRAGEPVSSLYSSVKALRRVKQMKWVSVQETDVGTVTAV